MVMADKLKTRWQDALKEFLEAQKGKEWPRVLTIPEVEREGIDGLEPGQLMIIDSLHSLPPATGKLNPRAFAQLHAPLLFLDELQKTDTEIRSELVTLMKNRHFGVTAFAEYERPDQFIFSDEWLFGPKMTDLEAEAQAQRVSRWRRK